MNKTIFLILFVLIKLNINAQSIVFSDLLIKKKYNLDFCEKYNDTIKFIINKSKLYENIDYGIIQFSDSLKPIVRYTIPTEYKQKEITIIKLFSIGKNWIVLSSYYNIKNKKQYVFARIIDSKGHRLTKWKKILDIDTDKKFSSNNRDYFNFAISPDKNKYLVLIKAKRKRMIDSLRYSFVVFDRELKILNTKKAKYGANSYHTDFDKVILTNANDVFLLGVEFYDVKPFHITIVYKKKYTLFHFLKDSIISKKVKLNNKYINSITMKYHKDTLYLGGYYSNHDYYSMAGGFSMKYINEDFKLWSLQRFPSYLVKKYPLKEYIEKEVDDEMFRFTAQSLEVDSLDNVYIIGQKVFGALLLGGYQKNPLYEYMSNYYYKYDDILLFKISENDRWSKVFKTKFKSSKYAMYVNPNVYAYSFVGNSFRFVLNDKKVDKKSFSGKIKYSTNIYSIDLNGRIELQKKIEGLLYSRTHYQGIPEVFYNIMYVLVRNPHNKEMGRIVKINIE